MHRSAAHLGLNARPIEAYNAALLIVKNIPSGLCLCVQAVQTHTDSSAVHTLVGRARGAADHGAGCGKLSSQRVAHLPAHSSARKRTRSRAAIRIAPHWIVTIAEIAESRVRAYTRRDGQVGSVALS